MKLNLMFVEKSVYQTPAEEQHAGGTVLLSVVFEFLRNENS
jgi:hypothetical protein